MAYDFTVSLRNVSAQDALNAKDDLIGLFNSEVIARDMYFQEMRKFEGQIFETIKWLYEQELWHVSAMEMILSRGNVMVKENPTVKTDVGSDTSKIIKLDVLFEERTVEQYKNAAGKCKGALKEILENLMNEEIKHVERLKEFLSEN